MTCLLMGNSIKDYLTDYTSSNYSDLMLMKSHEDSFRITVTLCVVKLQGSFIS